MSVFTVHTLHTQLALPTSPDSGATPDGGVGLHDYAVFLARLQDVLVTAVWVELDLVQGRLYLTPVNVMVYRTSPLVVWLET